MDKKPPFFYGWIVLAVAFVAQALCMGARNSFSVFYVEILNEFGWRRAGTAGIFSVNLIVYGITAPVTGALVDRFGPKKVLLTGGAILTFALMACSMADTVYHFYLLFGIASGIGASLIGYSANAPVLAHWFIRRRGMVFGILSSASGLSFLMIPLVQQLTTTVGWRTSFILVGLLVGAILLPLVAFFSRHRPQDMGLLPDGIGRSREADSALYGARSAVKVDEESASVDWTLRKAMRGYKFWLMFFAFFCVPGLVENLVILHQIALMTDAGLSATFAASIVALWGTMTIVGNLGAFLSDKIGRKKTFTSGSFISILGLVMLLLVKEGSQGWIPYLYAVLFGLGKGMRGPALGAAVADRFQGKNLGSIIGFMMLGFGFGGIVGPWFGGFIFDTTESYSAALMVAILVTCVACGFVWLAASRGATRVP